jgi:hypothetical protein
MTNARTRATTYSGSLPCRASASFRRPKRSKTKARSGSAWRFVTPAPSPKAPASRIAMRIVATPLIRDRQAPRSWKCNSTHLGCRRSSVRLAAIRSIGAPHCTPTAWNAHQGSRSAVAASESTCLPSGEGCVAPPPGAAFYPFYTQVGRGANCALAFGDIIQHATVDDFGRTAQYGSPNLPWFFGQLSGGERPNPCTP